MLLNRTIGEGEQDGLIVTLRRLTSELMPGILGIAVSDRDRFDDLSQSTTSRPHNRCKLLILNGEMSEWLKEHAWKACVGETLPWVRIPLSPPIPASRELASRVAFRHCPAR
jgi:hypothetical protein